MSILDAFGVDRKEVLWQNFGNCVNLDPKLFDEVYLKSPQMRPVVDEICSTCPVLKDCLTAGISNRESFVWGGHFLDNGEVVEDMNNHKTDIVKAELAARIRA